jgi:hypothetical protein
MTVREMKNDAVRRITLLDDNDSSTMRSIWLYITTTLPIEHDKKDNDERDKAKELAHSFLGAFSASRTDEDWKKIKEEYLIEKYGCK